MTQMNFAYIRHSASIDEQLSRRQVCYDKVNSLLKNIDSLTLKAVNKTSFVQCFL